MALRERLADLNVESRFAADQSTGLPVVQILSVLPTPGPPTIDVVGAKGSTTYTYAIVAASQFGDTPPSLAAVTMVGNATLSATNFNTLTWNPVPGATLHRILKLVSGTYQLLATVSGTVNTFNDQGGATSVYTVAVQQPEQQIRVFTYVFNGTNWVPETVSASGNVIVASDVNPSVAGVQQTPTFVSIAAAAAGDNPVVAAVVGKTIRVLSLSLVASANVNLKWRSAATDISGLMNLVANGGYSANSPYGILATAVNQALQINLSAAVAVGGHLSYVTV